MGPPSVRSGLRKQTRGAGNNGVSTKVINLNKDDEFDQLDARCVLSFIHQCLSARSHEQVIESSVTAASTSKILAIPAAKRRRKKKHQQKT